MELERPRCSTWSGRSLVRPCKAKCAR